MQIQARSIGEAVPRGCFDAVIQSRFETAVNMRLQAEGRLLTLLLSDHYDLPQGICIAGKQISFDSLTVGTAAACRAGILRFNSSPLAVDLRSASLWRCQVRELKADMRSLVTISAWASVWKLLNERQRQKHAEVVAQHLLEPRLGSLFSRRLSEPIREMITGSERLNIQSSAVAAARMIGLGPGVTPSGDDILVGFLAGLWSAACGEKARLSFIHRFADAIIRQASNTNEISRTCLLYAAEGLFSSPISSLAAAIAEGSRACRRAQEAMRVGHSSGMDTVTGLLLGLAVWSPAIVFQYSLLEKGTAMQEIQWQQLNG